MQLILTAAFLVFLSSWAIAEPIFSVSDAENRYQESLYTEMITGLKNKEMVSKIAQERGVSEEAAERWLSDAARLSSICAVLTVRLYEKEFKEFIAKEIAGGASAREIQERSEVFLRKQVQNGKVDPENPFESLGKGIEFNELCSQAVSSDPIPSYIR